jgi:hypothetical protein
VILAASIATPKVDWLALSPALALLAASAICLLGAVLVPRWRPSCTTAPRSSSC